MDDLIREDTTINRNKVQPSIDNFEKRRARHEKTRERIMNERKK